MVLNVHRLHLLREFQLRGTITAVAEALTYTPSAVSQQLAQLERDVGIPLLEQVGRKLRLTTAGEILCEHTTLVMRQLELAQADMARSRDQLIGTLRAAAFQTATLRLVPTLLSRLRTAHPELRVLVSEIAPDDALSALAARDYDIIVGEEYPGNPIPRNPGVHRVDLADDPLFVVTAAHAASDKRDLLDFADDPWVMEPRGNAAREWAERVCRMAGFEPDIRFESSDLVAHQRLAATGHAVAFLPQLLCEDNSDGTRMVPLPGGAARVIFTAVRRGSERRPDLAAFRSALAAAYSAKNTDAPTTDAGIEAPE